MPDEKIYITLARAKVFDEMIENVSDLAELLELVPEWRAGEAREIAQRMIDRQKRWVSFEQ